MDTDRAAIVVGADGSADADRAVRQAAREASWRGLPLRVVHAFIWPLFNVPLGPPEGGPPESGLRNEANRIVERAVEQARAQEPGIDVVGVVVEGAAPPVLIGEARTAEMIVVGSRGLGGFSGLLLGSVAVGVTPHAACPVLVVRGEPVPRGPVVVGVDGSPHGDAALAFALQEADWRQAAVRVVHAVAGPALGPGSGELDRAEPRLLAEAVKAADPTARHSGLTVEQVSLPGQPAAVLLDAARDAQLVVVGARGRGGFAGLLLGSVSHSLLHHAPCPVAVLRQTSN
ncbi:universal stress protein [Micromonospora sp. WMMD1120]|uniref:universal stress protein n=1 Tax=Micromonospora sp. WMMD1120 TaxID=3016106 RepID=UPI002416C5D5|nr:universal stress protein [Micromonospora sp. WMMD1120]MDG4811059.1 universal stress protein [Micromonospora sp. WMMD1120]